MQIQISDLEKQIQNINFFKQTDEYHSYEDCSNKKQGIENQKITDNIQNWFDCSSNITSEKTDL